MFLRQCEKKLPVLESEIALQFNFVCMCLCNLFPKDRVHSGATLRHIPCRAVLNCSTAFSQSSDLCALCVQPNNGDATKASVQNHIMLQGTAHF